MNKLFRVLLILCLLAPTHVAKAAGLRLRTPVDEITVGNSATKTVVLITAPSNQKVRVKAWSVSTDGTDSTQSPVTIELMKFTTAGTMTSITPVKMNQDDGETPQSTAAKNATVEPTGGDVYMNREIPFANGNFTYIFPFGEEILVKGGERIGIRVTNSSGSISVNVLPEIIFEE